MAIVLWLHNAWHHAMPRHGLPWHCGRDNKWWNNYQATIYSRCVIQSLYSHLWAEWYKSLLQQKLCVYNDDMIMIYDLTIIISYLNEFTAVQKYKKHIPSLIVKRFHQRRRAGKRLHEKIGLRSHCLFRTEFPIANYNDKIADISRWQNLALGNTFKDHV